MSDFKKKIITESEDFLRATLEAEKYVRSFLQENQDGIYSIEVEGAKQNNLYVGTAGILHFYIQLYNTLSTVEEFDDSEKTEDIRYLIDEMTRYLNKHAFDGINYAKENGEFVPGMSIGLYSGLGGIGLVANEAYRENQDMNAKECSKKILDYYLATKKDSSKGIYWTENSSVFFDGGIILYLIDFYNTYKEKNDEVQKVIKEGGDFILNNGIRHSDGGLELDHIQISFKQKEPNFEFGTAGAGYVLLKIYEATSEKKYLDAAIDAAKYVRSIGVSQKKGFLVPYKLGKYDDLFYLGNCHGPVGTAKLFYELFIVTKEKEYAKTVVQLYEGASSLGAPFSMSPGFWNTTCVCCGPAGYIPMLTGIYKLAESIENQSVNELVNANKWLKLIHDVGEVLVGSGDNGRWKIAFDRLKPDELTSPGGYFTGAAGIATTLIQVYNLENKLDSIKGFIDDPYLYRID